MRLESGQTDLLHYALQVDLPTAIADVSKPFHDLYGYRSRNIVITNQCRRQWLDKSSFKRMRLRDEKNQHQLQNVLKILWCYDTKFVLSRLRRGNGRRLELNC